MRDPCRMRTSRAAAREAGGEERTCLPTPDQPSASAVVPVKARFRKHGKAVNEKVGLYAKLGNAPISAKENGDNPYDVLDEIMGWERFVKSVAEAEGLAMPATHTSAATPRPFWRLSTSRQLLPQGP